MKNVCALLLALPYDLNWINIVFNVYVCFHLGVRNSFPRNSLFFFSFIIFFLFLFLFGVYFIVSSASRNAINRSYFSLQSTNMCVFICVLLYVWCSFLAHFSLEHSEYELSHNIISINVFASLLLSTVPVYILLECFTVSAFFLHLKLFHFFSLYFYRVSGH